eukprot:symbB.v1.2.029729.t1/scaffold3288.1/size59728/5
MAPWSVLGLGVLVGMLAVDAVFDFGDAVAAKSYYCTLLPSMFSFPFVLRVAIPVVFSGICILANLISTRSVFHVGTCLVLLLGGSPCFALSVNAVSKMCYSDLPPAMAMSTLRGTHSAMAAVFAASILLEAAGASQKSKTQ